ncbi:predicted protein [Sclerotinia sclerotiorum 1980 UF-70]|uniref:Uncharacterized protein n=1 Tax=Sclerotinia sclerotiorum (strain ATCC 18683 / 1980 / Ss-1) TaxID=665079 RepID=A7ECZ1_SCLS1|nr:predicted protein [Sclerotinia sclerotiorum 1980 UF-70]EDO00707.1 predicted protein [Sclerotinia sclerotiorum 1980 UF-70]
MWRLCGYFSLLNPDKVLPVHISEFSSALCTWNVWSFVRVPLLAIQRNWRRLGEMRLQHHRIPHKTNVSEHRKYKESPVPEEDIPCVSCKENGNTRGHMNTPAGATQLKEHTERKGGYNKWSSGR